MIIKNSQMSIILLLCIAGTQIFLCRARCQTGEPVSTVSDRQKLAPLVSVAKTSGASVWVEYHASCSDDASEGIPLELVIDANNEQGKTNALSAVRALLQGDNGFSISQSRPGIIDVKSADVWSPVLHAKLKTLKLSSVERYNPNAAIEEGIRASQTSLGELRARPAIRFGGLREEPSKERPHLKASTKYETLHDLLDDVVRTFGGVLVYKECGLSGGTHLFDIYFYRKE